jgi:carbon-monoxide dehydrogenase medium subunit
MKPAPFEYHAPESAAEAVGLLREHGGDAKPLAGGQSLIPMLALRLTRFEHLVDLNRATDLQGITRSNGDVRIGAMTRQSTVEKDAGIAADVPLLARATPLIGHFQIRNRGTVGGSLAHADPASEYPAVAMALGARFEVQNPSGTRTVEADDFFTSTWTTALDVDDLLTAVRFPAWSEASGARRGRSGPSSGTQRRTGFAVEEVARRYGDFALAGAAVAVELGSDGNVARAGIGLFGVGSTPLRARAVESALVGSPADLSMDAIRDMGRAEADHLDPPDDVHASGRYRKRVIVEMIARAVSAALQEASRA